MTAHTPPLPVCPTCGMPAAESDVDPDVWECRNESCPEFGQIVPGPGEQQ